MFEIVRKLNLESSIQIIKLWQMNRRRDADEIIKQTQFEDKQISYLLDTF